MSVEALWTLEFANHAGYGGGVVIFESGRIFGGDTSFYWTGTYSIKDGAITGKIDVNRHSPVMQSLLGRDSYSLELAGQLNDQEMELNGSILGEENSPHLVAILKRKAELP